jgi:hypothetical protein
LATTTTVYRFSRIAKSECKPTTPALSSIVRDLNGSEGNGSPDPSTTTNFCGASDDSMKLAAGGGFGERKEMNTKARRRANLKMVLIVSLVSTPTGSQSFSERHVYSHKPISGS